MPLALLKSRLEYSQALGANAMYDMSSGRL